MSRGALLRGRRGVKAFYQLGDSDRAVSRAQRFTIYDVRFAIYELPMERSRLYAIRTPGHLRGARKS